MDIDTTSTVPIFQQIVDGVCAAVAAGVYRPGDLVPSIRQQAVRLLVNPNTVQRAYEHLEREGMLVSRRGSGMEVTTDAREAAARRVAESVRGTFATGIEAGKAAKLARGAIDGLYRKAWNGE